MRLGIAADHGGFELKEQLKQELKTLGHEVVDYGAHEYAPQDDYPDLVVPLARAVAQGEVERGLAFCGSGVGASVAANKVPGVAGGADHRPLLRPPGGGGRRHEHHVPGGPGDLLCPGLGADPDLLEGRDSRGRSGSNAAWIKSRPWKNRRNRHEREPFAETERLWPEHLAGLYPPADDRLRGAEKAHRRGRPQGGHLQPGHFPKGHCGERRL